jgi:RNA-directed DNA polymerase
MNKIELYKIRSRNFFDREKNEGVKPRQLTKLKFSEKSQIRRLTLKAPSTARRGDLTAVIQSLPALLDRIWERRELQQRLGARIVRYADDIVLFCRRARSGQAMRVLRQILDRLELSLNEAKTRVVNANKESFDFLGFSIRIGQSRRTGNHYSHVEPAKKSLQIVKDRVTELTKRTRTMMPLPWIVNEVNATVRGWVGYFHYRNCSSALKSLRYQVEERLRTHLRKRHKVKDRGAGFFRFSSRKLYDTYGLYKVPTTAGWTKAHASR